MKARYFIITFKIQTKDGSIIESTLDLVMNNGKFPSLKLIDDSVNKEYPNIEGFPFILHIMELQEKDYIDFNS